MELILYNDDLGVTYGLNRAVQECAAAGVTTSAAIRTNGTAFDDAIEKVLPSLPDLELGLHLNLTEGRPDAPAEAVQALLDRKGRFRRGFARYLIDLPRDPALLVSVERELAAQFEKAWRAGLRINHVNGHQHIHMIPAVFEVVCRLMKDFGVRIVRVPREPWFQSPMAGDAAFAVRNLNPVKHMLLNRLSARAETVMARHGHVAVGCFIGVLYTGRMSAAILDAALAELGRRGVQATEVLFHPADIDDPRDRLHRRDRDLIPAYYFALERRMEKESLLSPALRSVLAARCVELSTHRSWAQRRGLAA
jgi:predicted glycoside hydrolase/deacetylase ChbG (UPF0249 family)